MTEIKLNHLKQQAEQGDPNSQYLLASIYFDQSKTELEEKIALDLFLQAAEQEHKDAQNVLAVMHEYGRGAEENLEKSIFWRKKAADNGHAEASYRVGLYYHNGNKYVEKDYEKSCQYWGVAAEQGVVNYIRPEGRSLSSVV